MKHCEAFLKTVKIIVLHVMSANTHVLEICSIWENHTHTNVRAAQEGSGKDGTGNWGFSCMCDHIRVPLKIPRKSRNS
jgi:hypothetical protein